MAEFCERNLLLSRSCFSKPECTSLSQCAGEVSIEIYVAVYRLFADINSSAQHGNLKAI